MGNGVSFLRPPFCFHTQFLCGKSRNCMILSDLIRKGGNVGDAEM